MGSVKVRKSPTQSATLYKLGTIKTGNDGNKWIIVKNKNNVKRWRLYKLIKKSYKKVIKKVNKKSVKKSVKKPDKKPSKKVIKMINKKIVLEFYDIPKIKKNNWSKWLKNVKPNNKKCINKIRKSYKSIKKETGINVIEVILPLSNSGYYWTDYVWDYAKSLYPTMLDDDSAYIIIVYKLNNDLEISGLFTQHKGIVREYKKKLFKYIEEFNKKPYCKCKWNGKIDSQIIFNI